MILAHWSSKLQDNRGDLFEARNYFQSRRKNVYSVFRRTLIGVGVGEGAAWST